MGTTTPTHATDSRGSPDRTEVGDVHLHTDTQQEQDHTELAEDVEGLVGTDEAQDGGPDDDAGDDLAHDRGHIDPLRDLGRQLRRDEHDEDVEEDRADVHGGRLRQPAPWRRRAGGGSRVPHRADLEHAEILPDQKRAGHAKRPEPLDAVEFLRPPHQRDLEIEQPLGAHLRHRWQRKHGVFQLCFADVKPHLQVIGW